MKIDWSKSSPGVRLASYENMMAHMPELQEIIKSFPDDPNNFAWDVKVHMLMPNQYPCIPNWHVDFVPRINGIQRFDLTTPQWPMYMWISGAPLPQFKHGFLHPEKWHKFTQLDEHKGLPASEFTWRCFIRAVHREITCPTFDFIRRHSQVYLDANSYQW